MVFWGGISEVGGKREYALLQLRDARRGKGPGRMKTNRKEKRTGSGVEAPRTSKAGEKKHAVEEVLRH